MKRYYLISMVSSKVHVGGIVLRDMISKYYPNILKLERITNYLDKINYYVGKKFFKFTRSVYDKLNIPSYMVVEQDEDGEIYEFFTGEKVNCSSEHRGELWEMSYEKVFSYCIGDKYYYKINELFKLVGLDKNMKLKLMK